MPGPHGSGERRLEDALRGVATALDGAGVPWMVIGGVALIARGVRRMTTDIDLVVQGDAISPEALLSILAKNGISPRIDGALEFAHANLILLLRHDPTGVDLDISLGWSGFEKTALEERSVTSFGRASAPMATPEALVVFKMIASRPKDLEDVEALLILHSSIDLARVRSHVADLAELAGALELPGRLDEIERRVRKLGTARRRKKKPRAH